MGCELNVLGCTRTFSPFKYKMTYLNLLKSTAVLDYSTTPEPHTGTISYTAWKSSLLVSVKY